MYCIYEAVNAMSIDLCGIPGDLIGLIKENFCFMRV